MNILVFEWFISLDWLENNCYYVYMIVIVMLRFIFIRSLYIEDDVFLNLNKINIDFYIYNIIKLIYD